MSLINHGGLAPRVHPTAVISPTATLSGAVHVAAGAVILSGAVVTAEGAPVEIGERAVIMENCVIRGAGRHPCVIGDRVLIGPHAYLSGCRIERRCFIATGAVVLNHSVVEEGSLVAVHAIVHIGTHLARGTVVPMGHIAIGDPARISPPTEALDVHAAIAQLGFTNVVFGFDSSSMTNAEATAEICERYSRALARHADDAVVA
jgi:carbonic anhydrase/acetyltransferase-like protein (isoleucine patch superfamily)